MSIDVMGNDVMCNDVTGYYAMCNDVMDDVMNSIIYI